MLLLFLLFIFLGVNQGGTQGSEGNSGSGSSNSNNGIAPAIIVSVLFVLLVAVIRSYCYSDVCDAQKDLLQGPERERPKCPTRTLQPKVTWKTLRSNSWKL